MSTSSSQSPYITQLQFTRALSVIGSLLAAGAIQPTASEKLTLYGLYKQATEGDCHLPRPSSRQVGMFAKWRAWDRLRGISPAEAQKYYVDTLLELLTDFIKRYPEHEDIAALKEALTYVQMENESIADGPAPDMFADVWNPSDVEQSDAETSELGSERSQQNFIPSTMQHRNSLPPHMHLHQRPRALTYANGSTSVFSNNSPHHEYPLTPELSPNPNQYTTYKRYIQPMDFLTNHPMQDTFSDTDTIDREVAATTSGLAIASPRQHPYHNAWQRGRKSVTDGTQTETTAPPVAGPIQAPERLSSSEQALENLQTEVAALCEQLDMMRRSMTERDAQKRQYRWTWLWLIKTIAKHAFANVIILLLVFLALWRQKSPIAYAIIGYVGPRLKEIMRYMVRRVVFWKVTV